MAVSKQGATRGTCEDGCGRGNVWVAVRKGFLLLCDDCAMTAGIRARQLRGTTGREEN